MSAGPFKHWSGKTLAAMERDVVLEVFFYFDGDKASTARALGVCVKTLYNKLEKYGVEGVSPHPERNRYVQPSAQMDSIVRNFPDARRVLRKKKEALRKYLKG